ncbi:RNA polymerase sigma factor [bacterium]|nr:RNA polymerase sigma factor [bacterium]
MITIPLEADLERELVLSARGGDREAFGKLVERYAGPLAAFASRQLDSLDEARDVAQATLVRALASIGSLRDADRFRGWVYAMALNEVRKRKRGLARLRRAYEKWRERAAVRAPSSPPDEERSREVRTALSRLPEKQRLAVELRLWEGLSCEEAATALGCTAGTIKANFHHAVTKLRAELSRSAP